MAITKIQLQPGINREDPSLSSEGFWYDSDKVRFKNGRPEKIGGWGAITLNNSVVGVPRTLFTWRGNDGQLYTAIGTHKKLYVLIDSVLSDITPLRETQALTNPFDTTNGSTTIVVNDTAHGSDTGDYVTFSGATHANFTDSEVNANHEITKIDDDSYSIEVTTACTGTASGVGGASVSAQYEISIGNITATTGYGWGAGAWGIEEWGDARTASGLVSYARVWSVDNFGEDLVATYSGGSLYQWDASVGIGTRAAIITNAPTVNELALVTTPDRHLVAFGAHDGSSQDPMLVKWPDQETLTDWTPTATNTAGSQVLSGGSRIVARRRSQGETIIWTDTGLHVMQFIGPPYTFGFREVGQNCGAIGGNCVAAVQSVNYWMGDGNFFIYDGSVRPLPCSVHSYVFDNIDSGAGDRVVAAVNYKFNEVTWFYAESTSATNNRYVTYNYLENTWCIGSMERTAWDNDTIRGMHRAMDTNGILYNHEQGVDANGSAMEAYIESAEFDIGDGDSLMFVRSVIPNFNITGNVDVVLKSRLYPQGAVTNEASQAISSSTTKIDTRMRGRSASIRVSSDAISDDWRLGDIRLDMKEDGKR